MTRGDHDHVHLKNNPLASSTKHVFPEEMIPESLGITWCMIQMATGHRDHMDSRNNPVTV